MELDFSELNRHLFTISDLFVVKQTAPGKTSFIPQEPRPTDALLLFAGTKGICYETSCPPFAVPQGALVYMPKGSHYIWENEPAGQNGSQEQYLFEFTLYDLTFSRDNTAKQAFFPAFALSERLSFGKHVRIVSTQHSALYKNLFCTLLNAFSAGENAPLSVYSAAYALFSTLSQNILADLKNTAGATMFEPLKNSLADLETIGGNKSIAEIASLCHISVSYYEKLFADFFGMSPSEYRNSARISHIKQLLQAEIALEEIVQKFGFCDCGYLCRFFKKQTGITPTQYRKLYREERCRWTNRQKTDPIT